MNCQETSTTKTLTTAGDQLRDGATLPEAFAPLNDGLALVNDGLALVNDDRTTRNTEPHLVTQDQVAEVASLPIPVVILGRELRFGRLMPPAMDAIRRSHENVLAGDARCRALFELAPVALYVCDAAGVIQEFNRRAVELWGREPLIGETDERGDGSFVVMRPDGSQLAQEPCPLAEVLSGARAEARDVAGVIVRLDGTRINVLDNICPLKNEQGEVTGAIHCLYDTTEQVQLTTGLRQHAAELCESDRRKNEFLAMLAHELRNPLAPIRNALQILRLTAGKGPVVDAASEMIERQVGLMVRMVDDLLDVTRIGRGKIELRPERLELASAVSFAVEAARAAYDSRQLELLLRLPTKPIYVHADPTRVAQVVANLLNNACKFTDPGGSVSVAVERHGNEAAVRVRDSGIGIAAEALPTIFEMFVQLENSLDRSTNGLGLGLTLVKNVVELHGGTVEAHSAGLGHGSEFVVRLPILVDAGDCPSLCAPDMEHLALMPAAPRKLANRMWPTATQTTIAPMLGWAAKLGRHVEERRTAESDALVQVGTIDE